MFKILIFAAILGYSAAPAFAAGAEAFELDRKNSKVTFSGELGAIHAGGRFRDVSATMLLASDSLIPSKVSYSANLKTVEFTEGGREEQMVLGSLAASLPQAAVAAYSSSSIEKASETSVKAKGDVTVFGRTYVMTIPFSLHRLPGGRVRATGIMKDRGKVLPFQVPGVSGEFNGVLKFDLIFAPSTE